MGFKVNLRIITKNHGADPEKGFSENRFKSSMAANGHAASVGVNQNNKNVPFAPVQQYLLSIQ